MAETVTTFCRICESLCGLEVTVEDGAITRIRPDDEHVATAGFACIKGVKQHRLYASPDRLRFPMRRTGDEMAEFAARNARRSAEDRGTLKQFDISAMDREILVQTHERLGLRDGQSHLGERRHLQVGVERQVDTLHELIPVHGLHRTPQDTSD